MKLLTVTVPCYNSKDYMEKCINSLLPGGDRVQIVIIDDGSKDATGEIADRYAKEYPHIVTVVHQENGGHGEGINQGLVNAQGKYFKVVDSDDWVSEDFSRFLDTLEQCDKRGGVDLFVTNYYYEHADGKGNRSICYANALPENRIFGWSETKPFKLHQLLTIHSCTFRTELLRNNTRVLPKHVFYEDNLMVYQGLPFVKKMYYMDVDMYHYYIGREDQSVNEEIMIGRIDQQIKVNKIMIEDYDLWRITNKRLRKYMFNYLEIITVVSTVLLLRSGSEENLEKKRDLWKYIKNYDIRLFHHLRNGIMGNTMNLPGKGGRKISVAAYKLTQKIVGFN